MIHIRGLWVANGSTRAIRAERQHKNEEAKRVTREDLLRDTGARIDWDATRAANKLPFWWVNI